MIVHVGLAAVVERPHVELQPELADVIELDSVECREIVDDSSED